ncbi:MAG: hypothetical protein Q9209_002560 [Squamulea sp. 1 TL-2023]
MASPIVRIDKHSYLISTAVLLGACMLSVTLRFYIRLWVQRNFSLDDAFLILAICCLISALAIMYSVTLDWLYQIQELSAALPFAIDYGFDVELISSDSLGLLQPSYKYLKWITVNQTLAWTSIIAVKFSFLCLFRKLIERMPKLISYWWGVVGFNTVAFGYGMATYFLGCPHYNNPEIYECSLPSGVARQLRYGIAQTAMDVIGDLLSVRKNGHLDSVWTSYFTIVAAEIGILLASVSTYRAFFVSYRKGEDDNKAKNKAVGGQEKWYNSKRELLKGILTFSPRRTRIRGQSTPNEGSGDPGRFEVGKLPDIPRAQMTGVRTFINGRGREIDTSNIMESTFEDEPYDSDSR